MSIQYVQCQFETFHTLRLLECLLMLSSCFSLEKHPSLCPVNVQLRHLCNFTDTNLDLPGKVLRMIRPTNPQLFLFLIFLQRQTSMIRSTDRPCCVWRVEVRTTCLQLAVSFSFKRLNKEKSTLCPAALSFSPFHMQRFSFPLLVTDES